MPLVIRYVDRDNNIQERFLKFIHCDQGVTGKALTDKILDCLVNDFNLDIQNCRGQCYDGAGNMAGKYSGVSSRILQLNPLALYTHCASHRLNLCVASAFEDQNVSNMMDRVKQISNFFNYSPKRQLLLEENIKKLNPNCKYTKLLDICRTRWVMRIDGLARFLEMYEAIVETMLTISQNRDRSWNSCAADASSFWSLLVNFNFLMTLAVVRNCLGYTHAATVQLQGVEVDILKGLQMVKTTITSLQKVRSEIETYHGQWFEDACEIAEKVEAPVIAYRVCSTQRFRNNAPSSDVSSHYKVNISIPFLDHLLQQFLTRFSTENCIALNGLSILPAIFRSTSKESSVIGRKRSLQDADYQTAEENLPQLKRIKVASSNFKDSKEKKKVKIQRVDKKWKIDFEKFCNQYADDLPDASNLSYEVDNWESFWSHVPDNMLPETIADTIKETNPISFPNISTALRILAVLPVTSCSCERSASAIRLLKTYTRSTMSQDRLNGLASLYTHKDIKINIQEVIETFARKCKRRLSLINLLKSDNDLDSNDESIYSEVY
ncbi:52 kDa repressor of the inhibitor of the protein kinase-like isoform X1 [Rhopilema esculentum]|uniref:52 kDa repressor of the inhibitor of the protein kinase-like isoform X1 n=1 Tax=Rhopilema esculentum TaxID=499914 RepID=UPI0031DB4047